ncbi:DNA mismatch repair endonuclease MutL [Microscilla marina]|uniref:DNA mismatch repair protein MutL n=1 Tax=Microscilla marina ATCC 23134 TaxID=313606 RepID=A1ZJ04_MICM2|nr:DNA mismatch repair endonuclease MutL [Microscilla marina]EAY29540.1 DNA mismatch repair protein MutL [Microscilla marina ATCC 23134]
MEDIIQLLPDSIANQIAAGEVVQRPASVVKELMENAIDAKSRNVKVIIKDAGKILIQVVDDGCGMSETDARLSFERHATSKIRSSDDLFSIYTMGFRGEALASIAAVAEVELKTKREQDELGVFLCMAASQLKTQEANACQHGTSIAVKNLFFNVPARKNFLKSNAVEMRHILDQFHRIALAYPEVNFSLYHNDTEVYNLYAGKMVNRITAIFGKNYRDKLAFCQEDTPLIKIKGYIGKPENAKKTRGDQFFFVNNRYIRHGYLHHAVMGAFEGLIASDMHPFYVLFIDIDPVHIDINVHPTKTEIKFDDERTIYAIIQAAVKKSLGSHNLTPTLDFQTNVNLDPTLPQRQQFPNSDTSAFESGGEKGGSSSSSGYTSSRPYEKSPQEKRNLSNWQKIYEGLEKKAIEENSPDTFDFDKELKGETSEQTLTFESNANNLGKQPREEGKGLEAKPSGERPSFQVNNQYIITPVRSGLMMIDQQAAHERVLYDKFVVSLKNDNGTAQQLLFPTTVSLQPADFQLVLEIETEIRNLGFIFELLPDNRLEIRGVPADITNENEQELFEGFIEQFKNYQATLKVERETLLARSLAKRSAIRTGAKLTAIEMNLLVDQLFASSNPNYTPDGRPTLVMLPLDKMKDFFEKPDFLWET